MRTNYSHPLALAEIEVARSIGKVGLTFCPGKQ